MPDAVEKVTPVVPGKVQPFDLADVRLLHGPFQEARARDTLTCCRWNLTGFCITSARKRVWKPKRRFTAAGKIPGWPGILSAIIFRRFPWTTGRRATRASKQRVDYIVDELALCQEKNGQRICSRRSPDGKAMFADVAAGMGDGVHRGWVPWYTDAQAHGGPARRYLYTGNAKAKDVLVKLSDWAIATTRTSATPSGRLC